MKSKLIQDGEEKTFAIVFDTGEEVVAGLLQFARDHQLSGAHLTAIGAFERVTLGFFDVAKKDYKRIEIHEQVELMSLVGNIAQDDDGNPKLHAHVVVGRNSRLDTLQAAALQVKLPGLDAANAARASSQNGLGSPGPVLHRSVLSGPLPAPRIRPIPTFTTWRRWSRRTR